MPQVVVFVAGSVVLVGWMRWAIRYRQYRRPYQDRELIGLLRWWFTRLPYGPVRAAATIAVVSLATGSVLDGLRVTAAVCLATLALVHLAVKRLFWAEWIAPTWQALCGIEDLKLDPEERRPGKFIRITRDWQWHTKRWFGSRHPDGINLTFPLDLRHYGKVREEHIPAQLDEVLGLKDVDYHWTCTGRASHLRILPAQTVPQVARFSTPDYRQLIETALANNPTAPVLAIGRGDQPITVDLDAESPHMLISAGTIGGKSRTMCAVIAQLLWADDQAIAVIVDKKEQSQRGLAAVPGVAYARSDEEINAALVAVWDEIQRRNTVCRDIPLGQPMPAFPRIIVGCEEMNVTTKTLNAWWRRENGNRAGQAPGIYALDNILCMGRAVRVNVVLDGQQVNANTTGGGEGRANIAVRILAEYGESEWKMLAHGADYIPAVSHKVQPGWCVVVHGRMVEEGQRPLMTDEEAHGWLTGPGTNGDRATVLADVFPDGVIDTTAIDAPQTKNPAPDACGVADVPARDLSVGAEGAHGQSPSVFLFPGASVPSMEAIGPGNGDTSDDAEDVYATLRDMVEDGSLAAAGHPISLTALRKAAQAPGFPTEVPMPGGYEYSRRAVIDHLAQRKLRKRRPTRGFVYVLCAGGESALRELGRMAYVKIGYTTRDPRTRAKEIAPYRPSDIVKLVEVAHPLEGEELPDKGFHREFHGQAIHPDDPTSELFWNRNGVREWLDMEVSV